MLTIDYKLTGIEGLSRMQVINALKDAYRKTGMYYRREMLPARFTVAGGRRLGYTPRKGEFRLGLSFGGKMQVKGKNRALNVRYNENLPLVHTGEARREALSKPTYVTGITRNKFVVPLPRKLNLRNPKSKVNMADEVRRVTNRELSTLTKFMVTQMEYELAKVAGSTRFRRVESATIQAE